MSQTPFGEFPSAESVAQEMTCARAECQTPEECWTRGTCLRIFRTDPKQGPRIRDSRAAYRKMIRERECRLDDCGDPASDGHHLLYRSKGGDDVEDNIIPLCRIHHDLLHFGVGDDYWWVREEIGKALTEREVGYVLTKLGPTDGASFLASAYKRAVELPSILIDESREVR